ncbi:MAG: protein-disulfide reductase DsbD domain-containing protein [Gracilimonas sp.]
MKRFLIYCFLILVFMLTAGTIISSSQPAITENAEVELISENETIRPGETFWIGVRMDLQDGWYVYYRNPGDSGIPLWMNWVHDKDFEIGEIQWPYLLWIDIGAGLASYGYYGDVLFMMEAAHDQAREMGFTSLILLGHENYYPRFGYKPAHVFDISFPFDAPPENCMVIELSPNSLKYISGEVVYPKEFFE